ncbi:LCP family glycopolymer transferase [Desertibacillus haloalkaliphilus]|uniref:LCP family glycopolymer transferase n=1 Tax=Desertibacillus haloalkaliphilus TaxID=1328930 RepID=UPI001C274616|nr:LCP family protein [Desertibacillus haloalkaliphilus]MBU8905977.1 LCP family protein [Desertibacillus haloalkaliphilus]
MSRSRLERKKRRLRRILKTFVVIGVLSFIILGGAAGYFVFKLADVTSGANQELERGDKSEMRQEAVSPSKDNISVLFLGVDDRDGDLSGRTDAMILATFNKEESSIKMTSIPRDTRVEIPGRSNKDKINHAHAFGGLDLAVETVESLFDIPVDYYVKLNFQAFIEIVDALDGVEVDVPFGFTEMDSYDNFDAITIEEGLQTLDGEEALAYARMRKSDPRGDIGRGERQQQIIKGIINKGASLSSISSYGDVLDSIENHISMNLSFGNLISLHNYAGALNEIESLSIEGSDRRIGGIYYYDPHDESIRELSNEFRNHLGLDN